MSNSQTSIQPKQKIATSEKDQKWFISNGEYWIEQAVTLNSHKAFLERLYRFALGGIDESDYSYVLNPFSVEKNEENKKLTKFPARLRNYNIILPLIKLLLGEAIKRPERVQVITVNASEPNAYKEEMNQEMLGVTVQMFVNRLNDLGVRTGVDSQKVPTIEDVQKKYPLKYDDNRAKFGQEAIEFIKYHQNLKDKYVDAFFHWVITGEVYTRRNIYRSDVEIEIIPPSEAFPVGNPTSGLYEDGDAFVQVKIMSTAQILDEVGIYLSDTQVKILDDKITPNNRGTFVAMKGNSTKMEYAENIKSTDNFFLTPEGYHNMYIIEWMGMKKVGVLSYMNQLGQIDTKEVDETYKLDKSVGDIDIEWEWINVRYETFRIDDDMYPEKGDYELSGKEGLIQRNELTNLAPCKLNFNGVQSKFPSVAHEGISYQILHNIFHYRFELTMAKHKDKLTIFPIGLIPKKAGWTQDKFLYYGEATGYMFYDETAPNAAAFLQGIKILDGGLSQYASGMMDILAKIKQEYWDAVGMNRQRYGESQASDGKSVTEQAIFRSAIISEDLHREFSKLKRSDYACALDYSKAAWINGKKGMYINSDGRKAFLENKDCIGHLEAEYGIFMADAGEEEENLRLMKTLAQPFAQNGQLTHIVAEVIDAKNMSKVKELLKQGDQIQQDFEASQNELNRQSQERVAENTVKAEQEKSAREKYKVDEDNKTKVKIAAINQIGFGNLPESEVPNLIDALTDLADREDAHINANLDAMRGLSNQKKEDAKNALAYAGLEQKDRAEANKMKIAKENKNKYDKK